LSPDVWLPGSAEPSLDDFVARVLRRIAGYGETHEADKTHVEVELGDGERFTLRSLSSEPGYGFLTLCVHSGEGEAEELIVPSARSGGSRSDQQTKPAARASPCLKRGEGPETAAWVPTLREMSAPAAVWRGLALPQNRALRTGGTC
jgi:hypothetical protein